MENMDSAPADQHLPTAINTEQQCLDVIKKIDELWAEGFKLYVSQDYEAATDKLSNATELSVSIHGEFAPQGFQLFYFYGRSLIEVARTHVMLVNPKAAEKEEDSSDGEKTDVKKDTFEDLSIPLLQTSNSQNLTWESKDVSSAEPNAAGEHDEKKLESAEDDTKLAEQTFDTDCEDGDDDMLNSVKLAWESLEVARRICEMQEKSKEWLEKKADVLLALGECMLVDDNFGNASDEFNSALKIQKDLFEPHDRRIADTLFHIALSHKNNSDFENAAEFFSKAAEVFKQTIEFAEEKIGQGEGSVISSEIGEMKQILKAIQDQVQDSRDSAIARKVQLEEKAKDFVLKVFPDAHTGGKKTVGEDVVVNDISDMVHRKSVKRPAAAKADDGASAEASATPAIFGGSTPAKIGEPSDKKVKLDDCV